MDPVIELLGCVRCGRLEEVDIGPALAGDGSMELECWHCGSRLATIVEGV